jgi:hypothetical protein
MASVHALLVYSLDSQSLLDRVIFEGGSDEEQLAIEATTAYSEAERKYANDSSIEVVLVAADSLATIYHTHHSYFREELGSLSSGLKEMIDLSTS